MKKILKHDLTKKPLAIVDFLMRGSRFQRQKYKICGELVKKNIGNKTLAFYVNVVLAFYVKKIINR